MGKTRPPGKMKLAKASERKKRVKSIPPERLLADATIHLQTSQPIEALECALRALNILRVKSEPARQLSALNLLGEINVELGEIDAARQYFQQAAEIDSDGQIPDAHGGGAEKFLWLAQLSEEGGVDSVQWFEKGADVLRSQIQSSLTADDLDGLESLLEEKRMKLANALCSIAEIYMTDLSWDDKQAEEQCNVVIEEALSIAPDSPATLQTAASVRISQLKREEARQYLIRSLDLWKHLDLEDPRIPDFPARISLSRLLMEAEMEDEAIEVLERLVAEDDSSVEAWYLGGWCLHLIAEKQQKYADGNVHSEIMATITELRSRSRRWLLQSLHSYRLMGYEDERLRKHAQELVQSFNQVLGEVDEAEEEAAAEEDDWEDSHASEEGEMEET